MEQNNEPDPGQQQQGQGKQQQKRPPNFPKCPVCGIRPVPKDKEACLVCCPIYKIEAKCTRGKGKWELIVETYKNGVQVKVSFAVDIDDKNLFIVKADKPRYWKDEGLAVISLKVSKKARKANFDIIGGPANIYEIDIPAEKSESFKWTEPDEGKGFWHNFRKGLRG